MPTSRPLRASLTLALSSLVLTGAFTGTLSVALASAAVASTSQEPTPLVKPTPAQDPLPTMQEALALRNAGKFAEAAAAFGRISEANPDNGAAVFNHAYCLHGAGDLKAAHDRHLDAAKFEDFRPIALYNHACVHALWNDKDVAFTSLREAMDAGFDNIEQLETDSDMDNLREDARFKAILGELRGEAKPVAAAAPKPLSQLAPERRFDFYAGEWEMRNGDTVEQLLTVTPALGGHGWHVSQRNASDNSEVAASHFVFDAKQNVWRQTWIGASGQIMTMAGGLDGENMAMRVTGDSHGNSTMYRSLFRDIGADRLTYAWQETNDDGKSWADAGTREFRRRR